MARIACFIVAELDYATIAGIMMAVRVRAVASARERGRWCDEGGWARRAGCCGRMRVCFRVYANVDWRSEGVNE